MFMGLSAIGTILFACNRKGQFLWHDMLQCLIIEVGLPITYSASNKSLSHDLELKSRANVLCYMQSLFIVQPWSNLHRLQVRASLSPFFHWMAHMHMLNTHFSWEKKKIFIYRYTRMNVRAGRQSSLVLLGSVVMSGFIQVWNTNISLEWGDRGP